MDRTNSDAQTSHYDLAPPQGGLPIAVGNTSICLMAAQE